MTPKFKMLDISKHPDQFYYEHSGSDMVPVSPRRYAKNDKPHIYFTTPQPNTKGCWAYQPCSISVKHGLYLDEQAWKYVKRKFARERNTKLNNSLYPQK